ncbi:MAG: DUF1565 domain-containing protein [Solirubrobacteraceae bacterium]
MPASSWYTAHRRFVSIPLAALAALCVLALTATGASAKAGPHVNIVAPGGPPGGPAPENTSYFKTIQEAVNNTRKNKGDWVLIEPGIYHEEVLVTKEHSDIHIRGMNRNTVILDGKHEPKAGGSNGIYVKRANAVWIENMTARNFDRSEGGGGNGNEFWWSGAEEDSNKEKSVKAHGWWGNYLTAYDDGLNGGYGIFAQHEREGSWEHIYASGFNDSGIYIGACWECQAKVSDATIEYNAVGYSGSNSGGTLVIEKSKFKHNSAGIVPNGENPGDAPPPQNGMCNAKRPHSPYYLFTSTNIKRCTQIKENVVEDNNNLEVPANHSTEKAPWGVGVELPGDMADLVENNTIVNNVNNGVLGFEYPNPFPPTAETIYFQLTGNKVANNKFSGNGTSGAALASDVTLQGGVFPHKQFTSDNNCVSGNTREGGPITSFPAEIEGTWGCANAKTPPPANGEAGILYVVTLSEEAAALRKPMPQPVPGPQETMPEPCEGVPTNPLCPG